MKRVALITGAAGGIGRGMVRVFAAAGWHVVGVDRAPPGDQIPGLAAFIQADVSQVDAWQQIGAELTASAGQVDALVNNAAVQVCKPLVETTPEEWDHVMAVNVRATYLAVRQCYPLLRQSEGAIVNISSVHAVATSAHIAAYAASKGALLALTRALAVEMAPDAIRVNAVLPGAVDTPMLQTGLSRGHLSGDSVDTQMRALGNRTVMGRVGQPEEIGQAALFLADNTCSSFMTGQALVVDGGATARLSTE